MTVRFILGRAGSGKTRFCLESIAKQERHAPLGPPLIFIVPEQATFQMEKELLVRCGGATSRLQVLSFRRLAVRYGAPKAGDSLTQLNETGRQMVLRRLLQQRSSELRAFGRAARQLRFCEKLSSQLREFKNYMITPEMLLKTAGNEAFPTPLREKISDLTVIFDDYLRFIDGRFSDPQDFLDGLAASLEQGALPSGSSIWVDGFAGFTPQEYCILAALLKTAHQIEITLCLDPERPVDAPAENELFYPTLYTYRQLRQLAGKAGVKAQPMLVLPQKGIEPRFTASEALTHLESVLLTVPGSIYDKKTEHLRLVSASNRRAEVETAARDILRQVRNNDWRYREIAVVLRDLNPYSDLVTAVFNYYGIPFFLDERRTATHHPLVELLRSALSAALSNFRHEDVFHMLKTDLFKLSRTSVDKLENYVLAHGIYGSHWLDDTPWAWRRDLSLEDEGAEGSRDEHDMAGINEARESFRRAFLPLFKAVKVQGKHTAVVYCHALWLFLESLGAFPTLQQWSARERSCGDLEKAALHQQVWKDVVALFEQLVITLGDCELTLQEFTEILQSGLEGMRAGLVPAALDQVVVGGIERSRQAELKAVYVLGLCDGEFPARLNEDGMFSDRERLELAEVGTELSFTRRQRLFNEQYLSYIALTRASQYVFASFPLSGEDGKSKRPSPVFNRLCHMFPENKPENFGYGATAGQEYDYLAGGRNIAAMLLGRVKAAAGNGEINEFWLAVYNEALQVADIYNHMRLIWPSLSYNNQSGQLSPQNVSLLYGLPLKTSVSRFELFARCPFAHFSRYGLQLKDRKEYRVDAPDMGNLYHAALRLFVDELMADGLEWSGLGAEEAAERMTAIAEKLVPRLHGEILLSSGRHRNLAVQIKENLVSAATLLTIHAQRSAFRTERVEVPFRLEKELPEAACKDITGRIELTGRIDRVDTATDSGGRRYVRIIDYKSKSTSLKLSDTWHGLSLQLLTYLGAAAKLVADNSGQEHFAAGALYFAVDRPYRRVSNPYPRTVAADKSLQMSGLILAEKEVFHMMGGPGLAPGSLNKDGSFSKRTPAAAPEQLDALRLAVDKKLVELGAEMLAGNILINPYLKESGEKACSFCTFRPLCRFESAAGGSRYRVLRTYSHHEILAKINDCQHKEIVNDSFVDR
ncbi:MAG: helicase-exonuclease AddAB subunit AddB [Dethiobacter sp.]|jgi:ATP-dependent helicase/nuclease subunit B|nr:helicase-exonuclease AddAB subunit AddB [Dethiobacter sp.]